MITNQKYNIIDLYLNKKKSYEDISGVLHIDIDSVKEVLKDYNVLLEFDVLWSGWDMDNTAWIMQDANGEKYLAMTSHGGAPYRVTKDGLEKQITEYEKVLADSRKALSMLSQVEA